ncbi:polysaccharide deacetylase family protein [Veillonella atypica]|nr:polysaccharide deacetylase family protein [Veillonella sp.]WOB47288.1 polysaccharide deacetylase family protein [Veillonella atypica]
MWCLSSHYKLYGVPVLNYHQVNDKYHSALTLDVAQFKKQMEYLHNEGYHTISLDDLYAYVTEGKELPDKPIVLTFDDGYIDNYEDVLPILESYDMQATIFMISDAVNTKRFMSINELKTMDAHKFIVEGHTNHHSILTRIDPSKLDNEIKGGKDTLQAFMGKPIDYLAYPGGFNNAEIQRITSESGYKMAFTVTPGTVKPGQNLYALPRLAIFQGDTPYLSFLMRLHCAPFITYTWQLRDTLRDNGFTKLAGLIPLF